MFRCDLQQAGSETPRTAVERKLKERVSQTELPDEGAPVHHHAKVILILT